jgi:hypothetical protein
LIDRYLYDSGRIDTALPFDLLREKSRITEVAKEAPTDQRFSKVIRDSLPPKGS